MPQKLVIEGLAAMKEFLTDLYDALIKCLNDHLKLYPDREIVFRQDSPSGYGLAFDEDESVAFCIGDFEAKI